MRVVGFILGIFAVMWGFILGGDVGKLFDYYSFAILVLGAFSFTFMGHGGELWTALRAAIGDPVEDAEKRERYAKILHTLRRSFLWFGFGLAFVGGSNMATHMDDLTHFGPALGVLLLSPLYGIVFAQLLLAPLINRMELAQR